MYYKDLSHQCQLASGPDIKAVGWLEVTQPFKQKQVPESFINLLRRHIASAWQPVISCGVHQCELCQADPPAEHRNLLIPAAKELYVAPAMIIHYIEEHNYCPPDEFIQAVMDCPAQQSSKYNKMMKKFMYYWQNKKLSESPANNPAKTSDEGFNWFGMIIMSLPMLIVMLHLMKPEIYYLEQSAKTIVLLIGSILFSVVYEQIQGIKEFSFSFATILLVVILGSVATFKFGWYAVFTVLSLYGFLCVFTGYIQRKLNAH